MPEQDAQDSPDREDPPISGEGGVEETPAAPVEGEAGAVPEEAVPVTEEPASEETAPADEEATPPAEEAAPEETAAPPVQDEPASPSTEGVVAGGEGGGEQSPPVQVGETVGDPGGAVEMGESSEVGVKAPSGRLKGIPLLILANTAVSAAIGIGLFFLFTKRDPISALGGLVGVDSSVVSTQPTQPSLRIQSPVKPNLSARTQSPVNPPPPAMTRSSVVSRRASKQGKAGWKSARLAYEEGNYIAALRGYSDLCELLPAGKRFQYEQDFARLRIGQCLYRLKRTEQAKEVLLDASEGISPTVRAVANLELGRIYEWEGQYVLGRMRAYLAAATAGALKHPEEMLKECGFLSARALSKKVVSLYLSEDPIPWSDINEADPFRGLSEERVQNLVRTGGGAVAGWVMAPEIIRTDVTGPVVKWSVGCWETPLVDFLEAFATRGQFKVYWRGVDPVVRERQISLFFRSSSSLRICEVAAGSVGLVARFTGEEVIVLDPHREESTQDRRRMLTDETESCWRRMFLRYPNDPRIGEGRFTLALLRESSGRILEAIGEYQVISSRFRRSRVAPLAMLRSAKLLVQMRNYTGARAELSSLLDRYPRCDEVAEVYAVLGDATSKAGLYEQGFQTFKKLYYLNFSSGSRALAAKAAGECMFAVKNYGEAIKWLVKYVSLAGGNRTKDLGEAYLLLGRAYTAEGDCKKAVGALELALASELSESSRLEGLLELASTYWTFENTPKGLAILDRITLQKLTDEQKHSYLSLAANIYRRIGLPQKSVRLLRREIPSVSSRVLRARLGLILSECYCDMGQMESAYQVLTEVLSGLPPGSEAHRALCNLAAVALVTNKPEQALAVTKKAAKSSIDLAQRLRMRDLVARAHLAMEQYEQAVLVFSDVPKQGSEK